MNIKQFPETRKRNALLAGKFIRMQRAPQKRPLASAVGKRVEISSITPTTRQGPVYPSQLVSRPAISVVTLTTDRRLVRLGRK